MPGPIDLTTLAADIPLSAVPACVREMEMPGGPEPYSPDRVMYLLWTFGIRISALEAKTNG